MLDDLGYPDFSDGGTVAGPDPVLLDVTSSSLPSNATGNSTFWDALGTSAGNAGSSLLSNGVNLLGQLGVQAENGYATQLSRQIAASTTPAVVPAATGTGDLPTWVIVGGALLVLLLVMSKR